jgi:light-regulated signal transduction histidine kinase (bacteriophytochrome)
MLFTDVTERKRIEDAQKEFAEQLKIQVEKRTLELEKANADLLHFMHVSSHDLKEPVRKIKTFASFLRNEYQKDLTLHADGLIAKILNASDRLNTMIEGVLNYSISDKSRQDISEIDLREIIKNIINDMEVLIHHKKVAFKIGNMLHIEGAKVLIYQVFYNIIYNSIKFSNNSVPLTININSEKVKHNGRDFARITFTDNGIGFEQEYAEKIFEPFFRLHSKDLYEGAGLGLALCRRLVERHSGEIYASGKLNEGAIVEVLLPVMQSRNYL